MNDPYTCDYNAKQVTGKALVNWGKEYNCTMLTAETKSSTDRVDLLYTAITPTGRVHYGIVECKERWNIAPGVFPNEFCNPEKIDNQTVNDYRKKDYTYLWCVVYRDADQYIIWNVDDVVRTPETRLIHRKTVEASEIVPSIRYHFDFNRAKIKGKISDLN